MKRILILAALVLMLGREAKADFIVAGWTFETYNAGTSTSAASPNLLAENGLQANSAIASGLHASASTQWSNPAGNGSAESFSSTNWTTGDYYQFQFSTVGFSGVKLSFDQTRSSTGPSSFKVQWSSNGTTFNDFSNYTVIQAGGTGTGTNSWGIANGYQSAFTSTFDLSGITQINGLSNAYIRLTSNQTTASGGTSRIDNVTISAVPEPTTGLLLGLGTIACAAFRRNRRVA